MTQKITVSDLALHQLMKGKTTKLTRYMKDEVRSLSKKMTRRIKFNKDWTKFMSSNKNANYYYTTVSNTIRGLADRDVVMGGYKEALKDDKNRDSKLDSLHREFSREHKKVISKHLRANNDCFMKNGQIVFRGSGSNAFALMLLHEHGYNIISDEEKSVSLPTQVVVERSQPRWKLTKRYTNEYRNSCTVESCPCDYKPSEECIAHMKSIRML